MLLSLQFSMIYDRLLTIWHEKTYWRITSCTCTSSNGSID